ncbi:MAG: T9SS type A sorting domain-containing protein [Saprospiraceae bacterium]|nr:T9SS type A sorting domain-containing protein [Saprospiraceae bacterium]
MANLFHHRFKGLYIDNIRITGTTGVNDAEASRQFLVFPNPTSDYFSLDIPTDLRLTNAELRMYDLYGRLVMSKGLEIQESQDISTSPMVFIS